MKAKEILTNVAKGIGTVTLGTIIFAGEIIKGTNDELKERDRIGSYSEAVEAIANSNMFSSSQQKILSALNSNLSNETYKSIVHIVNSNMFDSAKVTSILSIIEKDAK